MISVIMVAAEVSVSAATGVTPAAVKFFALFRARQTL